MTAAVIVVTQAPVKVRVNTAAVSTRTALPY